MKILLASVSARRREMLTLLGHEVAIKAPDIVEIGESSQKSCEEIALVNARAKAHKIFSTYGLLGNDVILGADTVVGIGNNVFGKPKDRDDAFFMLSKLAKGLHEIWTSYCLIRNDEHQISRTIRSRVEFRSITADEINAYLRTEEWRDKAGGYAVQGLGAILVRQVEGSLTNVIGLPLEEVLADATQLINEG